MRLLQDENSAVRSSAALVLGQQTTLPAAATEALVRLLQDRDQLVRSSAAEALGQQTTLPSTAAEALVRLLQDGDQLVRRSAVHALGQQTTLPGSAVEKLISIFQVEILSPDAERILEILEKCESFYTSIVCLSPSSLQTLLTFWLKRSFEKSITFYIWNDILSIDIDGKLRRIPLETRQHEVFRSAYVRVQEAIGSPEHYIRQMENARRRLEICKD
jgi:hypothetical protein